MQNLSYSVLLCSIRELSIIYVEIILNYGSLTVVIGFGQSLYNVSERDRSVTVQVVLTGGTNRPVTVRITSRDGTAVCKNLFLEVT